MSSEIPSAPTPELPAIRKFALAPPEPSSSTGDIVPFPSTLALTPVVPPKTRRMTFSRRGTRSARCIRQPFTLRESVAVAIRTHRTFFAMQQSLQRCLDAILAEGKEAAIDFFEEYSTGGAQRGPDKMMLQLRQAEWWERIVVPILETVHGGRAHTMPRTIHQPLPLTEMHWHNGDFGRHGVHLTLRLYSGVGQKERGYCERHTPFAATVALDVFTWLRDLLLYGPSVASALLAEFCHHEIAHLSAYDTPHSLYEEKVSTDPQGQTYTAHSLRSVEIFCSSRGRAAYLYELGHREWLDERADGATPGPGTNVLSYHHRLPKVGGWDVEKRRKLFNRVGQRYFQELAHVVSTPWKNNWPNACYGLAVLNPEREQLSA